MTQDEYVKRVAAEIEATLPGVRAEPAAERAANNQFVDLAHSVAWGTSSIALLIGILPDASSYTVIQPVPASPDGRGE